jgi:hypothetical protein
MIAGHDQGKILFPHGFVYLQAYPLLHDHDAVYKFGVGMPGAIKKKLIHIFYFYRLILLEKIRVQIQAGNLHSFNPQAGAACPGTDF